MTRHPFKNNSTITFYKTGKQEYTSMARMTSDMSNVKTLSAIPKNIYDATLDKLEEAKGKKPPFNPQIVLTWKVVGGDCDGSKVPFDRIVVGGKNDQGVPIQPFRLADLIESLEAPWSCLVCHPEDAQGTGTPEHARVADFVRASDANQLPRGYLYCPDCLSRTQIVYETSDFLGKQCRIAVDVEKVPDSDRERNAVKGYLKKAA